jgi:small subunit ribosomal protein S18
MYEKRENSGSASSSARPVPVVRNVFFRRVRKCPLTGDKAPVIDYKDTRLLVRYVSERGRIMPSRITSVSAKKQREMSKAIKRARVLALLPFVGE